jgi:hypothetical protein
VEDRARIQRRWQGHSRIARSLRTAGWQGHGRIARSLRAAGWQGHSRAKGYGGPTAPHAFKNHFRFVLERNSACRLRHPRSMKIGIFKVTSY